MICICLENLKEEEALYIYIYILLKLGHLKKETYFFKREKKTVKAISPVDHNVSFQSIILLRLPL